MVVRRLLERGAVLLIRRPLPFELVVIALLAIFAAALGFASNPIYWIVGLAFVGWAVVLEVRARVRCSKQGIQVGEARRLVAEHMTKQFDSRRTAS